MATWKVGANRSLPLATDEAWDGASAAGAIFEWAGGDDFDPAKARQGFLVYDSENPSLKGSYKLPFALVSGGRLKASPAGIRAAASRLPQTDIPDDVQTEARGVIDAYERRMQESGQHAARRSPEAVWRKAFATAHKAMAADDATMALINRYAVAPVTADQVFVGQMDLANDQLDRSFERFPVQYLQRFAQTLPGKSLMPGHDYSQMPLGRFLDAEVIPTGDGGHVLRVRYFTRANAPVTADIQLGVAKDASIGFIPDQLYCDLCGRPYFGADAAGDYCPHWAGESYDGHLCTLTYGGDTAKVEAVEGSLVWLGCQYGAQTVRSALVAAKRAALAAGAPDSHLLTAKSGGTRKEDEMELKEAMEKIAALEAKLASAEPLAKDGEQYRAWLKTEITRLYTSLGEATTGAALLKHLEKADGATLEAVRAEVDARHAKAFARTAGETGGAVDEPAARSLDEILCGTAARRRE